MSETSSLISTGNGINGDINDDDDDVGYDTHFDIPNDDGFSFPKMIKLFKNCQLNYILVKACLLCFGLIIGISIGVMLVNNHNNPNNNTKETPILRLENNHNTILLANPSISPTLIPTYKPSMKPTTNEPTTTKPTTAKPTTLKPTTANPTTAEPTNSKATTGKPTTTNPTTAEPTSIKPTASTITTTKPTTSKPTTTNPTTGEAHTIKPTTTTPSIEETIYGNKSDETPLTTKMPVYEHSEKKDNDRTSIVFNKIKTNLDDSILKYVETKVEYITRDLSNIDGKSTDYGTFYGPYMMNTIYPNDNKNYDANTIKKWCYHINFKSNSIFENIDISIKFIKFNLEIGFDRILIRNYNDTIIEPVIALAGRGNNGIDRILHKELNYHINNGESKSICIEFQSDNSITFDGINYNFEIKYDPCKWTNWVDCYKINLVGVGWSRGPFSNGKCGVGITWRNRTTNINDNKYIGDGFSKCINMKSDPEYCIKGPWYGYIDLFILDIILSKNI